MKRLNLREYPLFWINYRNRVLELTNDQNISDGTKIVKSWYCRTENFIKDWYGFDIKIDQASSIGTVIMNDRDYTLFILKYGK